MIDWVTFFQQNPFLLNWTAINFWWIWIWSTAASVIFAYPLMHPFNYMMNRMDNERFNKSEYWWSEKTFQEVYPTYRSYVITYSLSMQIYYLTSWLPWKIKHLTYPIRWKLRPIGMKLRSIDYELGQVLDKILWYYT